MTDLYKQLLEERARAKSVLDGSAVWIAWRAADAALRLSLEADDVDRLSAPPPILIPEEVVNLADSFDWWDEQDPVLLEYTRVRRAEELREQLINNEEWHSFQEAQQRLLVFVKGELAKKREALEKRRSSTSQLSSHGDGPLPPPPLHPSAASPPMVQTRPAAESIAPGDSSSPPDTSSSTLHIPVHAVTLPLSTPPPFNQVSGGRGPSSSPPIPLSKEMDSSSILGSSSQSMTVESAVTALDSSVSHSPQSERLPIALVDSSESSAGLTSSSSSSAVVVSETSAPSTTADKSTSRITQTRHALQRTTSPRSPRSSPAGLKRSLWCLGIVEDGGTVLSTNQLGLVDHEVREMCASLRPQVQRIWSDRGPRCLIAAPVTAQRFTAASWSHPTQQQMDELRQRVHDEVERWTDEQFAAIITDYTRTEYVTGFLDALSEGQLDMSFLQLFQAVDHAHPRVYVISVSSHAGARQASLDIFGNYNGVSSNTPCIVLYRHLSSDNHFEAVSWKPSRGGTPLTASFSWTHEFIVALEKWNQGNSRHSQSPSPTRKRRRTSLEAGEMIDLVQDELTNGAPSSHELTNQTPSA